MPTVIEALTPVLPLAAVSVVAGLLPSRFEPTTPFLANQRWRYRDVFIVLSVLILSQLVGPPGSSKTTGMRLWAIVNGSRAVLMTAAVWGVIRWKHQRPWRAVGFNPTTALDDILWSLRIGLAVVAGLAVFVLLIRIGISDVHSSTETPRDVVWRGQLGDFIAALLVTAVLIPLAEELFFRGLAYGPLFRRFGRAGAAVASAMLWAAGHYSGVSVSSAVTVSFALALGVVYADVYRLRESLVPTLVFHMLGNTTAVFIRDRYLETLVPLAGIPICLWIMTETLSRAVKRLRTRVEPSD